MAQAQQVHKEQAQEELKTELYRTLVLVGADPILLGTIKSWSCGTPEAEVLADLRNWNEAKVLELKEWMPSLDGPALQAAQEHIRHYEEASRPGS